MLPLQTFVVGMIVQDEIKYAFVHTQYYASRPESLFFL